MGPPLLCPYAHEINYLRGVYSSQSVSEATSTRDRIFALPCGPLCHENSPSFPPSSPHEQKADVPVCSRDNLFQPCCMLLLLLEFVANVDKLEFTKLQPNAGMATLKLMDCVLTIEDLVNGNPSSVTKSKHPTRQKSIHGS